MNIIPPTIRKRNKNQKFFETEYSIGARPSCPLPIINNCLARVPSGGQDWKIFKANFENGVITCDNLEDAKHLWLNGYFGNGSLSRFGLQRFHLNKDSEKKYDDENPVESMTDETIPVHEVIRLGLEEAMFLSYGLGVLVVSDSEAKEMNIDMMWTAFYQMQANFPPHYTVYHHFRSKGWIVKFGLKFGADFMLYPKGPPLYHSQFLVWIEVIWEDTLENDTTFPVRISNIGDITALERLSGQTGKNLILCQVIRPRSLANDELKNIGCVKQFKISTTVLKRWIIGADADGSEQIMAAQ